MTLIFQQLTGTCSKAVLLLTAPEADMCEVLTYYSTVIYEQSVGMLQFTRQSDGEIVLLMDSLFIQACRGR